MFTSPLPLPIFVVNFKAYVWGIHAVEFARKMEEIAQKSDVYLCAVPQILDIYRIAQETNVPLFSPHLDSLTPGRGTGRILPEAVKEAGAVGMLLNHTEHRLPLDIIPETIERAREVGLMSLVAASSPEEAETIATLGPEAVVAEPSDRIGTLKSVGRNRDFVVQSIEKVKTVDQNIIVICAAGVSSRRDVAELVKLGVEGTGASRAIFEAKNPVNLLSEMVKALDDEWKAQTRSKV